MNKFICVEGVDGVGKSTAVRCASYKRKANFMAMKSPPEKMSKMARFYDDASPQARFFFYLSSVAEVSRDVKKSILHSDICCDRYLLSTIAYHNIMCKREDLGRYLELASELGLVLPDKNIILLADIETRTERIIKRMHETSVCKKTDRDLKLTERVQREYIRLAESGICEAVFIDVGKLEPEEIAERILSEFGEGD